MFDISFVELLVIGAVGLLVLGPEKLAGLARTTGRLVGRARQSWNAVRREREISIDSEEKPGDAGLSVRNGANDQDASDPADRTPRT